MTGVFKMYMIHPFNRRVYPCTGVNYIIECLEKGLIQYLENSEMYVICFNSITLILFLVILTQTMYVLRYSQLILCRYRDRDIGHRDREKVRMPKIATKNVS